GGEPARVGGGQGHGVGAGGRIAVLRGRGRRGGGGIRRAVAPVEGVARDRGVIGVGRGGAVAAHRERGRPKLRDREMCHGRRVLLHVDGRGGGRRDVAAGIGHGERNGARAGGGVGVLRGRGGRRRRGVGGAVAPVEGVARDRAAATGSRRRAVRAYRERTRNQLRRRHHGDRIRAKRELDVEQRALRRCGV